MLILNPDLIFLDGYFEKIQNYLNDNIDFSIIGSQYQKDKMNKPAYGLINYKGYNPNITVDKNNLQSVDWVVGCSMLIDLDKFANKNIFDDNFFLFYEEN